MYSYDRAGRVLTINRDADGIGMAQFGDDQRFAWDVLPVGISCPSATDCKNLTGRLALAESTWSAGVLRTFYGYTTQGQVAHETLQTQPGTNFRTGYQFDTAGRLTDIDYPLGTGDAAHYVYAGTGDADNHQVSRLENWFFGGFFASPQPRLGGTTSC